MQVVACTMEEVTSPEQRWEQATGKSFCQQEVHVRGLLRVPSPLLRFPPHVSCQMANQLLCGHAPNNVQKPAVDMRVIVFSSVFFLFKH